MWSATIAAIRKYSGLLSPFQSFETCDDEVWYFFLIEEEMAVRRRSKNIG